MKTKTIKTDNRYILVDLDKSNIKFGDKIFVNGNTYNNTICEYRDSPCPPPYVSNKEISFKILVAYPPINGIPEFETLPPNTEDDIEKLAKEFANNSTSCDYEEGINVGKYQGFIAGYKQAKSETMFSLEQVKQAIELSRNIKDNSVDDCFTAEDISGCTEICTYDWKFHQSEEQIIQVLTTPKQYEFMPETIRVRFPKGEDGWEDIYAPQIVNNKIQGVWIIKNKTI